MARRYIRIVETAVQFCLGPHQKIICKNHITKNREFKLYYANCLDVLAELPENSVDMIFADPPYLLSNGGFTVHAGRRVSVNKGIGTRATD